MCIFVVRPKQVCIFIFHPKRTPGSMSIISAVKFYIILCPVSAETVYRYYIEPSQHYLLQPSPSSNSSQPAEAPPVRFSILTEILPQPWPYGRCLQEELRLTGRSSREAMRGRSDHTIIHCPRIIPVVPSNPGNTPEWIPMQL